MSNLAYAGQVIDMYDKAMPKYMRNLMTDGLQQTTSSEEQEEK